MGRTEAKCRDRACVSHDPGLYLDFVKICLDFVKIYLDFVKIYLEFVKIYLDFVKIGRVISSRYSPDPPPDRDSGRHTS